MNARDASGVPAPLRELLGVLGELAERPPLPADSNWRRMREVEDSRGSMLRVIIDSLNSTLTVHDRMLSSNRKLAEEELGKDCERRITMARERLAEPLGYEPQPEHGEDGAK